MRSNADYNTGCDEGAVFLQRENTMTQSEFRQWIESILGNMPMEEVVSTTVGALHAFR